MRAIRAVKLNKIWVKLSAVIVVIVLLLMTVVFQFITRRQIKTEREQLRDNMQRIAMQVASIRLTASEDLIIYQEWIKRILDSAAGKDIVYIAIFDKDRRILAYALNAKYLQIPDADLLTPDDEFDIIQRLSQGQVAEASWNDFDHVPVEIRTGRHSLGKVDVGFSLIDFNNKVKHNLLINMYILAGAFLSVVALSVLIGRRITRPLDKLSTAMMEVSRGNLAVQVRPHSKDELGRLADSFNYMTLRLREKGRIDSFSQDLVLSFEHSKLLQMVTDRIVNYMGARQGVLFLIENRGVDTFAVSTWGCPRPLSEKIEVQFDEECLQECFAHSEPFSPDELRNRSIFDQLLTRLRETADFPRVDIIAPMISQGETLGFLLLAPEIDQTGYDADEKMFLRTLSQQAGMAVRNSFLLRDLAEQERLQKELEIARAVQQSLLPVSEPIFHGLVVSGVCIPAEQVGGDYYDYFIIDDHRMGIAIADVSGKGTSAAFYMAEIKGMMTSLTHLIASPKELLQLLNKNLNKNIDKRIFTTMIYGVLDISKKEFAFVRAGHNALLVKRADQNGDIDVLIPPGIALGLASEKIFDINMREDCLHLNSGDMLFFYTDGLSEAMNDNREEFGEERLYSVFAANHDAEPREIQREIMREVNNFVKDADQHDDITMVIAKFN
jgi:serine phosphatase RsbU (regulator of sigma subunit)/HAMP domain-containing protein